MKSQISGLFRTFQDQWEPCICHNGGRPPSSIISYVRRNVSGIFVVESDGRRCDSSYKAAGG